MDNGEKITMVNLQLFEKENPELFSILTSYRGEKIFYYPNQGNAGDSMIAAATYQIFAAMGIDFELISSPGKTAKLENSKVILGGGGNFVPMYGAIATFLKVLSGTSNEVLLLSHSIRGHQEIIKDLKSNVTLFCRENDSIEYLKKVGTGAQYYRSHDLAVYMDANEIVLAWKSESQNIKDFESKLISKGVSNIHQLAFEKVSCIRGGAESTLAIPKRNFDISDIFRSGVSPELAFKSTAEMLYFCYLAREVETNRMHIAVACGLISTNCMMLDNSYGKLSSVYDVTLKDKFTCLKFDEKSRSTNRLMD